MFREKRDIKSEKPDSNVTIKYPAKLVVDGLTVKDMFPDWFSTLKKSRLFSTLTTEEDSADESDMEQGIVSNASSNDARQQSTLRASRMDIPRTTSMGTDTVTRSCSMAARITYQDDSSVPSKKPPDTPANQNA